MASRVTTDTASITVSLPLSLCGMELSKNGRYHWASKHRAFQQQKDAVLWMLKERDQPHWGRATMDVHWRYARGVAPDDDNLVSRVSAARDAFAIAGIVDNDRNIRVGAVTTERVRVGWELAIVTLREDET